MATAPEGRARPSEKADAPHMEGAPTARETRAPRPPPLPLPAKAVRCEVRMLLEIFMKEGYEKMAVRGEGVQRAGATREGGRRGLPRTHPG